MNGNYFDIRELEDKIYAKRFKRKNLVNALTLIQQIQVVLGIYLMSIYMYKYGRYLYKLGLYKVKQRGYNQYKLNFLQSNGIPIYQADKYFSKAGKSNFQMMQLNLRLFLFSKKSYLKEVLIIMKQFFILKIFTNLLYNLSGILTFLNPLWSNVMLLKLFSKFPIFKSTIQALWKPKKQLLLTVAMLFILTYYFAIIFFYFYNTDMEPLCDELMKCFLIIFDQTYKGSSGFLTSETTFKDYIDEWDNPLRVIVNLLYTFAVCIIISEIISGIVIDTFKSLRE